MEDITLPLKEIVDKGFPEPHLTELVSLGSYKFIDRDSTSLQTERPVVRSLPDNDKLKVGFYFDGQFLPTRNGASYTLYNLMRSLSATGRMDSSLINCFRGWDDPQLYTNQVFRSVFIHPRDYYHKTGIIEEVFEDFNIQIAQFYNSEILLNLASRLKRIGRKVIYEVQNIDHVLLQRLDANPDDINVARNLQKDAFKIADHTFCRSEIDRQQAVALGADEASVSVYKGGIYVRDFTFKPRLENRKKLVYLGHMYYQPNENALDHLVYEIMPNLDDDCTLTVIGNTPPSILKKYVDPRVVFCQGVDDLDAELLEHDIAVAPLCEGSGTRLKILDYLASGLPVVSTSLAIEGLDPKISELVTIEDDLAKFAGHIRAVITDPVSFAYRSFAAREFMEQEYDWSECIDSFTEVYENLMEKNEHR